MSKGLEGTFDTVSFAYERLRPGYPDELYQAIRDYIPLGSGSRAIEVGPGGGQATLPVLRAGAMLTAVEYGPQLADLCREKFKAYPNFTVITGKFEDVHLEKEGYDLIYSASAFHWVPEEVGYPKVFSLLKQGGAFARFANHPYRCKDQPTLMEAIDRVYDAYYYQYYSDKTRATLREYTATDAQCRAIIAGKYGFTDIRYFLFYRTRTFTAAQYAALLGTYSDHIALPEPLRSAFFRQIEETIDAHGGRITLHDTIDLQLARKP